MTANLYRMAAQLEEARNTVRRLWPLEWRQMLSEQTHVIKAIMEARNCNEVQAMIEACKVMMKLQNPHGALLFMAACVEMVEPLPQKLDAMSHGY